MITLFLLLISSLNLISSLSHAENNNIKPDESPADISSTGFFLKSPDNIIFLPAVLHEISGITEIDSSTIACVQDENGVVFIYDITKNIIKNQLYFHSDGDYEGITRVEKSIFILRSDGVLFEIENYESQGSQRRSYLTMVPAGDYEGLCYDKKNNLLLIAPKVNHGKGKDDEDKQVIYGFNLNTKKLNLTPAFKFDLTAIKRFAVENNVKLPVKNKKKGKEPEPLLNFMTSAIGIHPLSKKLFIISGSERLLFVFDMNGTLEYMENLKPGLFIQPEGITFLDNGDMLISNEGRNKKATLLRFNYKK